MACELRECQRYGGTVGPPDDPLHICEAFPQGIPQSILIGRNLHLKSVQGDNGLLYDPPPGGEPSGWRVKLR